MCFWISRIVLYVAKITSMCLAEETCFHTEPTKLFGSHAHRSELTVKWIYVWTKTKSLVWKKLSLLKVKSTFSFVIVK